jgi:hypothetical protein
MLIPTIAAFALSSAVGVFAQQQPAPSTPTPGSEPAAPPPAEKAPTSTVSGCVVQAKTTDGGTVFILTKAEGASAATYVLGGSSQSEWPSHVNKKVEVTGAVQEPAGTDASKAQDPRVLRPPLIVVESVKVVAQSCS